MRLISFTTPPGRDAPRLAVVVGDRGLATSDLGAGLPATMDEVFADVDAGLARLRAALDAEGDARIAREGFPLAEAHLTAPVPRPGKIVAIGRNYPDHTTEQGAKPTAEPIVFAKFNTSVVGPGDAVTWDAGLTSQVDYEAELAVVIGWRARNVSEADAFRYVLGYTCLNDVSARDLQFADKQWVRAKSLDTFCPIGPALVTLDDISDPNDLAVTCRVNGEVLQSDRTSNMFFSVAQLIGFCSRSFTLEPGDVIATGTPGGVGAFREPPIWLKDGDVMTVGIEGVGELTNTCREAPG